MKNKYLKYASSKKRGLIHMPVFGASLGSSPNKLPVEQVRNMRGQGMDNNKIIQILQRDGYSSSDIFDAMNQADVTQSTPLQDDTPPPPQDFSQSQQPPVFEGDQDFMSKHPPVQHSNESYSDSSTEELVEAIIDEKWNELLKDINKVIEWKNASNAKILRLEQQFSDLKAEFDKIHSAIISKIDDYDKNITNVGAEVRAMEKVFSKVLPVFTENVSELSKIAKDIKKGSKK